MIRKPLPFPKQCPAPYIKLTKDAVFEAQKHLQLEKPTILKTLKDLGYDDQAVCAAPSPVAITSAFRLLSDEGLDILYHITKQMENNKNVADATGANRLGSYVRGAGYRSQFVRDMFSAPELTDFVQEITGVPVASHSMPSIACGINYVPDDITRAVDSWHVDSISFDIVMLLVNPTSFKGGEFQYFLGTREEGEKILGGKGEEGFVQSLPDERVVTVNFPHAGYGFLQQGNMVFHRACRLLEKAERITCIPSFVLLDSKYKDGTNIQSLVNWSDPGMLTELARHLAWTTISELEEVIEQLELHASASDIAQTLEKATADVNHYIHTLKKRN